MRAQVLHAVLIAILFAILVGCDASTRVDPGETTLTREIKRDDGHRRNMRERIVRVTIPAASTQPTSKPSTTLTNAPQTEKGK